MQALRPLMFPVAIACGVISTCNPSASKPRPITSSLADHGSSPCGYGAPDGYADRRGPDTGSVRSTSA
jgi:hypothetical protein